MNMNTNENTRNERRPRIISAPVPLTGSGFRVSTGDLDTQIKQTIIRDRAIKALQTPQKREQTTIRVKDLALIVPVYEMAFWMSAALVWGVILGALLF